MNILLTGGTGLIGKFLTRKFQKGNHTIWILTRGNTSIAHDGRRYIHWDGKTAEGWGFIISGIDVVINLAGEPLTRWPWTKSIKKRFSESRKNAGHALVEAIRKSPKRPKLLIQISGINHYGTTGDVADENTSPGRDFLSTVTQDWEEATKEVEQLGVRRCIARLAVVLSEEGGLFPLMSFPVRMFLGGPNGTGNQIISWIHIQDVVEGIDFLINNESSTGPYNFIAPEKTTNAIFNQTLAKVLNRPYWFKIPALIFEFFLGEMSILILEGREVIPKRLIEEGYHFRFRTLHEAINDLAKNNITKN